MSLNTLESVSKASKKLLLKESFYGMILMTLNKKVDERIGTACVSKNNINLQLSINPHFWEKIRDEHKLAVLKHELLHVAFFHLHNFEQFEDRVLFNIAADLEINQYIEESWKGKDWFGLEISNYPEFKFEEKKGTKYYYDVLSNVNKKRQQQGNSQTEKGNGESQMSGDGEGESQNDNKQSQSPKSEGGKGNDGKTPETSKIWDLYDREKSDGSVCNHDLWKEFEKLTEAEKKLIKKQVEYQLKELAQQARNRGTIPGELKSTIDALFEIEPPVIDWKAYFRRFTGSSEKVYTKKTRYKLSKRFSGNPGLRIKHKKNVLVAIDTSGSVSDKDLQEFFSEIHHIYKAGVNVTIIEADTRITNKYEYKGKTPEFVTGRGGTDFDDVIHYYNDNFSEYSTLVYLTDGECSPPQPKPKSTMLWIVCSTGTNIDRMTGFPGMKVKMVHNE